jgi:hypothetical protein
MKTHFIYCNNGCIKLRLITVSSPLLAHANEPLSLRKPSSCLISLALDALTIARDWSWEYNPPFSESGAKKGNQEDKILRGLAFTITVDARAKYAYDRRRAYEE